MHISYVPEHQTEYWGPYLIYRHQWSEVLISQDSVNCQSQDKLVSVCTVGSQYVPVLCGVGHSSNELHSFGVVVNLSMQAEILLDKVIWGHELLAILVHHTGILARRQTAPALVNNSQEIFRGGKVSVAHNVGYTRHVTYILLSSVPHVIRQLSNYLYNAHGDLSNISLSLFVWMFKASVCELLHWWISADILSKPAVTLWLCKTIQWRCHRSHSCQLMVTE